MYSFIEALYSPYVKYFSFGEKTLTQILPTAACDQAVNEIVYLQDCYNPLYYIDLPAVKGAVYIENCEDL